jgi:putative flippase GtrA
VPRSRELVYQLARFAAVGVSNSILSYVLYLGLVAFRVPYLLAGAGAFAAGSANGYRLNRRWTFRSSDSRVVRLRYAGIQLGGLIGTTCLLRVFVDEARLGRLGSYAFTIPLVALATFAASRGWAFTTRSPSTPGARMAR